MLVLLLPLTLAAVFLCIYGSQASETDAEADWRSALLQSFVILGVFVAASSEALSLLDELATPFVAAAWGGMLLSVLAIGTLRGAWGKAAGRLAAEARCWTGFDRGVCGLIFLISAALLVVAVLSPPNNNDSLLYHMARVVHWAQNRSLEHYATAFYPQLVNPIWAELAILHLRLLWGNDRLAALVQWCALVASAIGVSLIAKLLGARRNGQWAAAAFAISVPMGLLQATSTQNDYVVAFWLVSAAYYAVLAHSKRMGLRGLLGLGAALGLGLLTKGTFYAYCLPLVLWVTITLWVREGAKRAIGDVLLLAAIVAGLNLGYWSRNVRTFGTPLGPRDWVASMTAKGIGPMPLVSSLTRNVLLNFATPSYKVNESLMAWWQSTFGLWDPASKDIQLLWAWNHEDLAGSPVHALLVPISLTMLLIVRKRIPGWLWKGYMLVVLGMAVALAAVVKEDQWGVRYQLPFWIAWAPLFGLALDGFGWRGLAQLGAVLLLISTLPWVLFNRTRPLIGMKDSPQEPMAIGCIPHVGCEMGSILVEPEASIMFTANVNRRDGYEEMAATLARSSCKDVGLRIDSHDPEYLYWWLLAAPQSGIRIESIYTVPGLEEYVDLGFKPCAIVCTICGERTRLHGLELEGVYADARLYTGDGFVWDKNG